MLSALRAPATVNRRVVESSRCLAVVAARAAPRLEFSLRSHLLLAQEFRTNSGVGVPSRSNASRDWRTLAQRRPDHRGHRGATHRSIVVCSRAPGFEPGGGSPLRQRTPSLQSASTHVPVRWHAPRPLRNRRRARCRRHGRGLPRPRYEAESRRRHQGPARLVRRRSRSGSARFQREAEVLASLNHPNIARIHGLEESERHRARS